MLPSHLVPTQASICDILFLVLYSALIVGLLYVLYNFTGAFINLIISRIQFWTSYLSSGVASVTNSLYGSLSWCINGIVGWFAALAASKPTPTPKPTPLPTPPSSLDDKVTLSV